MNIIEVDNYQEMSDVLVKIFAEQITEKPDSVLSFTTGKTPQEFLVKMADAVNGGLDISQCVFLNLDEYVGKREMPYSVYSFMHTCLYDRISMQPRVVDMMNAEAADKEAELARYGEVLKKYHRDIQLLGLGTNGHVGANEPGTPFTSTLFVADSFESTIDATQNLFHLKREETPTQMFTMGFTEIMDTEHVILAASGKSKTKAVQALVEGGITENVPASFLRTHKNFTLIIDKEAGSLLSRKGWNFISTWKMSEIGVEKGIAYYQEQPDIHRAIVEAVKEVEDAECYHSVGYGGLPNREGIVELDAAYMNGDSLRAGGVMAVHNVKNPIIAALELSHHKRNCFLAGKGAENYAVSHGCTEADMLSPAARERYEEQKQKQELLEEQEAYDGHDTVCIIGRDENGSMGCGVSTSGLFMKHPGRVGDSPIIGSGFYADSKVGAAAATGVGEDIMRGCLSYAIVDRISRGYTAQKACEEVLGEHVHRLSRMGSDCGSMSVIAMDKNGNIGAATNLKEFAFVVGSFDGTRRLMIVEPGKNEMKIYEPSEKRREDYKDD